MRTARICAGATAIAAVMMEAAQAKEYSLQNAVPKNTVLSGESADYFADQVRAATAGEIDFTDYGAGELSPPSEILDNAGSGALDAGWTFPAYSAAQIPAVTLFVVCLLVLIR